MKKSMSSDREALRKFCEYHVAAWRAKGASGGIAISSGEFTKEAKDFVRGKPLELIAGAGLAKMVTGVRQSPIAPARPALPIKPLQAKEPMCAVPCPLCGQEMVLRTAKKGPKAGERFWGCSAFPKCRGTMAANPA